MTTRRQLMQGAAATMLGLTHLPNFAQTRLENLRITVGFPPGGTTDTFARRIAEKMRGTYANNVIVDNKPGAGGQIGVTTLSLQRLMEPTSFIRQPPCSRFTRTLTAV